MMRTAFRWLAAGVLATVASGCAAPRPGAEAVIREFFARESPDNVTVSVYVYDEEYVADHIELFDEGAQPVLDALRRDSRDHPREPYDSPDPPEGVMSIILHGRRSSLTVDAGPGGYYLQRQWRLGCFNPSLSTALRDVLQDRSNAYSQAIGRQIEAILLRGAGMERWTPGNRPEDEYFGPTVNESGEREKGAGMIRDGFALRGVKARQGGPAVIVPASFLRDWYPPGVYRRSRSTQPDKTPSAPATTQLGRPVFDMDD